jgi:hypothetical protein
MDARQITCGNCHLTDDASYFNANLQACPACGVSVRKMKAKQQQFNKIRCARAPWGGK